MNFLAITQFFHITYIAIMDYLLTSERQNNLVRPIFYYYSIIKINGRNMLYLYYML